MRKNPARLLAWAGLLAALAITLFPFWWMVRTALTGNAHLFNGSYSLLPDDPTMINFERILGLASPEEARAAGGTSASMDFWRYLQNSVVFAAAVVAGQVTFSAMAAYAFARLRFRGRDVLFYLFLSTMMIPPIFTVLPNFVLIKSLGGVNTFWGLVAPYFFMTPFAVFFLRQFFLSVPGEIEEAAGLDGASRWRIFWQVVVPMNRGPLVTLAIITAVQTWNEFLWPLLVAKQENVRVLTTAMAIFQQQTPNATPDWAGLMAGATLAVLPVLLLLILFGRRLVDSIRFTGIK
ncbi:carbohydrate ABC transporter permease [Planotetraspora kaengkrachanensis]|uniref:Sugar ABC transporter permease n=1 Tax=Planotetraspora kaengkrachanensis TaxID=575193 RepID=A0A8J3PQN1_9ACTN|nr:carbohydrate ABC transporter permease [Planotetraspora kaengkrachanensis]GIG78916.1 sugar ABC transporter permease [Planotetraspora kaengkrachanensis]